MFVVDTNVLVDAADRDSPFHTPCKRRLAEWQGRTPAWFLTWGVCYEFLRVATHPRVFRKPWRAPEAWRFIASLLASPALTVLVPTDRHARVAGEVFEDMPSLSGNTMHDATTAILMREHGIKTIYTRDTDFHRFRFLDVVDPTA